MLKFNGEFIVFWIFNFEKLIEVLDLLSFFSDEISWLQGHPKTSSGHEEFDQTEWCNISGPISSGILSIGRWFISDNLLLYVVRMSRLAFLVAELKLLTQKRSKILYLVYIYHWAQLSLCLKLLIYIPDTIFRSVQIVQQSFNLMNFLLSESIKIVFFLTYLY